LGTFDLSIDYWGLYNFKVKFHIPHTCA
jgi:hypothetical protein